jgi:hypothetical protein
MRWSDFLRAWLVVSPLALGGCQSALASPTPWATAAPPGPTTAAPFPTATLWLPTEPPPTPIPRLTRSIDLVANAPAGRGEWFSVGLDVVPETAVQPEVTFVLLGVPQGNRRNGQIAPTLAARYVFLQFGDIRTDLLERQASTVRALFIRSALMSFVDDLGGRVLDWDGRSRPIPLDLEQVIGLCNRLGIPAYLELNYSDYIPGPVGSGVDDLVPADNLARTVDYLKQLEASGLHLAGVTFGDEIGDDAGFGDKKPTLSTSDLAERFVHYARGLKTAFPRLSVYAFDSDIGAAEGQVSTYFDLFRRIRQAEVDDGRPLLDGFLFRESYVYINRDGKLMSSQRILADTDSLHEVSPVYRYDSTGNAYPDPDEDYLHTLIAQTEEIFGRPLEIVLSEYLPAGPTGINESDTSPYADIDFILHYADVVGIYATLGLDYVSTWVFANSTDQAKCYLDRQGQEGVNFPVHAQIAENLRGETLQAEKSPAEAAPRLRVYAARRDGRVFVMILNREVSQVQAVRITLPGELDVAIRLPPRSYTSLIVDHEQVLVSGIGG